MFNKTKINNLQKGFTLLEVIIIIIIIGIISSIILVSLSSFKNEQILKNTSIDVVSLLNKARQNTLSSINSKNYGVHFETNKMVLFGGQSYSQLDISNEIVIFSPAILIPSLNGLNIGGGSDVIFDRLTGETIGGTIILQLSSDNTKMKIITISKTGIISSN